MVEFGVYPAPKKVMLLPRGRDVGVTVRVGEAEGNPARTHAQNPVDPLELT